MIERCVFGRVQRIGCFGGAVGDVPAQFAVKLDSGDMLTFNASGKWKAYLAMVKVGDNVNLMLEASCRGGTWRLKAGECSELGTIDGFTAGLITP